MARGEPWHRCDPPGTSYRCGPSGETQLLQQLSLRGMAMDVLHLVLLVDPNGRLRLWVSGGQLNCSPSISSSILRFSGGYIGHVSAEHQISHSLLVIARTSESMNQVLILNDFLRKVVQHVLLTTTPLSLWCWIYPPPMNHKLPPIITKHGPTTDDQEP